MFYIVVQLCTKSSKVSSSSPHGFAYNGKRGSVTLFRKRINVFITYYTPKNEHFNTVMLAVALLFGTFRKRYKFTPENIKVIEFPYIFFKQKNVSTNIKNTKTNCVST